jgi:hypothetical protein
VRPAGAEYGALARDAKGEQDVVPNPAEGATGSDTRLYFCRRIEPDGLRVECPTERHPGQPTARAVSTRPSAASAAWAPGSSIRRLELPLLDLQVGLEFGIVAANSSR